MEPLTARFVLQQTVLLLLFAITAPLMYYIFDDMLFKENNINFHGAGDSIIDYQYTNWASKYTKDTDDVTIEYNNDTVIQVSFASLGAQTTLFVPYDDPYINSSVSNFGVPVALIATGASAIGVIINGRIAPTLQLSQEALVGIYSCNITHWNDTIIQATNPNTTLPTDRIIPLHFNTLPSSQTFIFTEALCQFSGEWCDSFGVGSNITWCSDQNANITNDFEMLAAVQSVPFSIGYLSLQPGVPLNSSTPVVSVANAQGEFLLPVKSGVQNVMNFAANEDLGIFDSLSNLNCSSCYPITGWTYLFLEQDYSTDCHSDFKKLIDFIHFILDPSNLHFTGQYSSFVLPNNETVEAILDFVDDGITCNGQTKSEIKSKRHLSPGRIAVVAEAIIVIAVFIAQFMWFYRERNKLKYSSARRTNQYKEITPFLQEWGEGYKSNTYVDDQLAHQGKSERQLHPTVREMKVGENSLEFWGVIKRTGFGDMYEGRWNRDPCIIKKIVLADKPEVIEELAHEISLITRIRHPNIVQFYAVSLKHPMFYIISEYCDNGGLNNILEDSSLHLPLSQRLQYAVDAANGMKHLHSLRIIHRDLKVSNMLLDKDNAVKIADYSISKFVDDPNFFSSEEAVRTRAPEVTDDGKKGHTTQSDVFSYGICLWEILTRSVAFADTSSIQIRRAIVAGVRPPTGDIWPKEVANLVEACWDPVPGRRPSFDEIIRILLAVSSKNLYISNKMAENNNAES